MASSSTVRIASATAPAARVGAPFFVRQNAGRSRRRETGAKKSLASVDVAQSGDPSLVEQAGFQRGPGAGEQFRQAMSVKFGRERLGAEPAEPWMLRQRLARRQVHEPKSPRVVVSDDPAVIEAKNDVIVLRIF